MSNDTDHATTIIDAAVATFDRGFVPIPIGAGMKRPAVPSWTRLAYDDSDDVRARFQGWTDAGHSNLGVLLGEPSDGLVDVDIDHPKAARLRDYFLPDTPARSGRAGSRASHYWYVCSTGTTPGSTRQHLMPRNEEGKRGPVAVELRSTLSQSVIPGSVHPSGEPYLWEGEPWGGAAGPALVHGKVLAARVAMLGLAAVLLDNWPTSGSRHEAYLALAGGLLRYGDSIHPFWGDQAHAAEQLIAALARATNDDDGSRARVSESVFSTMRSISMERPVRGFPALAEIIGQRHVDQVRILMAEVESAAGFVSRQSATSDATDPGAAGGTTTATSKRGDDPLSDRTSSWQAVSLEPYLTGRVKPVMPTVLVRSDGEGLMYPGRVNMLYGNSESAKSWIGLWMSLQVIQTGQRAIYLDFEDEPVNTLSRLGVLGASPDDLLKRFTYVRPEDPLAAMQRDSWGKKLSSGAGEENQTVFDALVDGVDPTLIVADGMSVIYGLHGLNTNDTVETEVITSWLKRLTRNGRTTVVVIDHTPKGGERGAEPIGSQHKTSMVQGTLIQVYPITQPVMGGVGRIELITTKDRPGYVRKISRNAGDKIQVSAIVTMDSTQPGITMISVDPPPDPAAVLSTVTTMDLAKTREAEKQQRWRDQEDVVKWIYRGVLGARKKMSELRDLIPAETMSDVALSKTVVRLVNSGWLQKTDAAGTPNPNVRKEAYYELIIGNAGYEDPTDAD